MPTTPDTATVGRLSSPPGMPAPAPPSIETVATSLNPLPVGLRDDEITEADVAVLARVARDKKSPAGRYRRTPKPLPTAAGGAKN